MTPRRQWSGGACGGRWLYVFGFLLLVSGDCLKTNPSSLREMSKGCPPLSMNSGTHQLSHAYLRLYSQMGPTSLVPAPLMGTADLVSARIPSVSCLWWDMKTSTNSGWRPPLIFFPQPAHIGLAEHLCLWLRDRRLCKVVLQDLPRTHPWKLIAALLGWV